MRIYTWEEGRNTSGARSKRVCLKGNGVMGTGGRREEEGRYDKRGRNSKVLRPPRGSKVEGRREVRD